MNDNNRRLQYTLSTDCVLSDDDENEEEIIGGGSATIGNPDLYLYPSSQHSSNLSSLFSTTPSSRMNPITSTCNTHHGDDDGDDSASLYVNAKTEENESDASTIVASHQNQINSNQQLQQLHQQQLLTQQRRNQLNPVHLAGKGKSSNSGVGGGGASGRVFQRLSKSASILLSQDRQTISELLNVNVDLVQQQEEVEVQKSPSPLMQQLGNNHIQSPPEEDIDFLAPRVDVGMDQPSKSKYKSISNETSQSGATASSIYLIQELEERHQQQLKEKMNELHHEWEQKLLEQERTLRQSYQTQIDELNGEIDSLKQQFDKNTQSRAILSLLDRENSRQSADSQISCDFKKGNSDELIAELTPDQISRYSRQLLLNDGFGVKGQKKLLASSVLGESFSCFTLFFISRLLYYFNSHFS